MCTREKDWDCGRRQTKEALLGRSVMSNSFVTPWTVARQARLSMGFPRQEYWSGLPLPLPGDLPYPGIKPRSSALQADPLQSEPPGKPQKEALDLTKFLLWYEWSQQSD